MEDPEPTLAPEQLLAELGWIRALAHRLVTDPNVADDVLQRVCLVALEKPPRNVSGTAGIRRWLSTLTRRTAAHSQRADHRRARRERRAARCEALPPTVDLAERREVLHQLVDSLTDLEARDQELLTLRYFEGLGIGEIATRLELTDAAVRQRLSRARRRLRERLERDAGAGPGADRTRWLAALGLATLAPAAHLLTASRVELARHATETALSKPIGVAVMAKVASSLSVKVALGLGLVTAAVVTAWQGLESDDGETLKSASVVNTAATRVPDAEPMPLPVVPEASSMEPVALAAAPSPADPSVDEQDSAAPVPPSDLQVALDEATVSFVTLEPDLQALNDVLRQLALAASVVPDSVSKNPSDGTVNGWVEIAGTELMAKWSLAESGKVQVDFGKVESEDYPEPFSARSLSLGFTNDQGNAVDVSTVVHFDPYGHDSQESYQSFIASLSDREQPIGWQLEVGPQGTSGTAIAMRRTEAGDGVFMTLKSLEIPSFTESWANDTSPYDLWLALLVDATH